MVCKESEELPAKGPLSRLRADQLGTPLWMLMNTLHVGVPAPS